MATINICAETNMARSRLIKPGFFENPGLAQVSPRARLGFIATWQMADRLGVFEWDIMKLRKYAFGYEDVTIKDVEKFLDELLEKDFLKYSIYNENSYGLVINLTKHQIFHHQEKSKYSDVFNNANWVKSRCSPGAAQVQPRCSPGPILPSTVLTVLTVPTVLTDESAKPPIEHAHVIETQSLARKTKWMEPLLLGEYKMLAEKFKRPIPENWDSVDAMSAGKIYSKYPQKWKDIVRKYLTDEFYGCYGWSIQSLAKNIDQIANRKEITRSNDEKRQVIPSVNDVFERRKINGVDDGPALKQELALEQIQRLKEKLRF